MSQVDKKGKSFEAGGIAYTKVPEDVVWGSRKGRHSVLWS